MREASNTPISPQPITIQADGMVMHLLEVRDCTGREIFHVTMTREFVWGPGFGDATGALALTALLMNRVAE